MSAWDLPTSLSVGGKELQIRTDYRAILDILKCFSDPDFEADEQWEVCLRILFTDRIFENFSSEEMQEAMEMASWFIDMGMKDDGKVKPRTMDWEQDASVIIPSVNRVIGKEIRALEYLHWWTFLGAYMEIGESLFSQILSIRIKKSKGKKLEKWEREFYKENKHLIDMQIRYTEEEKEEKAELIKILDGR